MSEYFRAADIKAAHRSTTPATLNMINTLFGKNELCGLHKREYAATSESIPIKQPHISAGEESSAGAQPILQKSFKGAWGQISPTSAKWLQATLLAKCEAGRVRRLASSKVGTALPCLPVRFPFCKGTLFLIEGAPGKIRSRTESCDSVQH